MMVYMSPFQLDFTQVCKLRTAYGLLKWVKNMSEGGHGGIYYHDSTT